jgi:NAD(P)-dependent dehydrogenase (short-subunit alcohol dehydrogenase family)
MSVWFITGASRGFGAQLVREALAIVDDVEAGNLPARLFLGSETPAAIEQKIASVRSEIAAQRTATVSTDHADAAA